MLRVAPHPGALLKCAYCHALIEGERDWRCLSCSTPYHLACAAEGGRCGVLGCAGTRAATVSATRSGPPRGRLDDSELFRVTVVFVVYAVVFYELYQLFRVDV
jgi:hypothetical protein